jgi:hypothetical protein
MRKFNPGKVKVILMSFIFLIFIVKLYSFGYNYAKNKLEIKK